MFSDKIFQISLLISVLVHGAVLLQNTNFKLPSLNKKEDKTTVTYVRGEHKTLQDQKIVLKRPDTPVKAPPKIIAGKVTPPPFIEKDDVFRKEQANMLSKPVFDKPAFIKTDIIAVKKKITLPPIDINKINNPSYINYYQIMREKIRRAAYQNYTRTETGEVYLSFIISGDGYLKEIKLSEEKSSSNTYLREIALRSVKESSPFPRFPTELDYSQLSFNVVISFEVE